MKKKKSLKNKRILAISIGVIIVSIATPLTIFLLNKKLENKDIHDTFDSDLSQRHGNKYFTNTETSLNEWGIKLNNVIKNHDANYDKYHFWIEYLDYDFVNNKVKAKLFWSKIKLKDKNAQSKNVTVGGFAAPKTTFNENDKIQESEFANMFLPQGFTIPSTVTEIKRYAFNNAKGSIPIIPDTVKKIDVAVFEGTTLPKKWNHPRAWREKIPLLGYSKVTFPKGFHIPDTVRAIGFSAFSDSIIPPNWKYPKALNKFIPANGFSGVTFSQGFKIPESVIEIRKFAFEKTKGAIPLIPNTVKNIKNSTFLKATLPQGWVHPQAWNKIIPYSAYEEATLPKGFKIPDTVAQIGKNAFLNVKIPKGTKWSKKMPIAGSEIVDK